MERSAPTEVCDISRNCASVNSPAPGTSRSMTYLGMSILRKLCHASMHVRPLQECRSPVEPEVAARVRETCVGNEGIMDLRSLQKPLKEQYRADPNASQITCQMVAAAMSIPTERIEVTVEGDLDLRGTLGISKEVLVGFENIRMNFDIAAPGATAEQIAALREKTEQYCVVMQTLLHPPTPQSTWTRRD